MTLPNPADWYDDWRAPVPECADIGTEEGDPCDRFPEPEPDEDQPRGYRPTRCDGEMAMDDGELVCSVCGELA